MTILDRELLNARWQRVEKFPGDGSHFEDGHSRRRPFADSLSASSKSKSSLPVAESAAICSSHRLCSRRRNHWTMCRYSFGDRLSIAASISSTRLMPEVYHRPVQDFIPPENRSLPTPPHEKLPMPHLPNATEVRFRGNASSNRSPFKTTGTIPPRPAPKMRTAPGSEAGAAMTRTQCRDVFRAYPQAVSKTMKMAYYRS